MGWICRIEVFVEGEDFWMYKMRNCDFGMEYVMVDVINFVLGNCLVLSEFGCMEMVLVSFLSGFIVMINLGVGLGVVEDDVWVLVGVMVDVEFLG